ncbi:hypothetical protein WG219_10065 [Ectopseudomonas mendocina]|uniref:Uncharacterized protein n=1 Tax=Ectopseudomonas mendocina TaxID=300 RepID=A0ABZ2RL74_ECTME
MSYGLLIRDATGREIINSETFTVRQVDTIVLSGGITSEVLRFQAVNAAAGMFAVAAPATELMSTWIYDGRYGAQGHFVGTDIPAIRVGDGFIELFPPMWGGTYMRDVIIYLFANL